MRNIEPFLKRNHGKTLLAIYPHPDDESFTSGGLLRRAKKLGLNVELLCLTKGGSGLNSYANGNLKSIREKELFAACRILEIDCDLRDFKDAKLKQKPGEWMSEVKKKIKKLNPAIILTFDTSGITGHPDHIATSVEVLKFVKRMHKKPVLFWRSPDSQETKQFAANKAIKYASKPNYVYNLSFKEAVIKLLAIFAHKSQMKNIKFMVSIFNIVLTRRYEYYHRVNPKNKYEHKFFPYKIYPNYASMTAKKGVA